MGTKLSPIINRKTRINIKNIVQEKGGFREQFAYKCEHKEIPHQWDTEHRVVEIKPFNDEIPGCFIDLETKTIVG